MMSRDMRGKCRLVGDRAAQMIEMRRGLLLDPRPPQIDKHFGVCGRRLAGQPLAHHERHGLLERRIPAIAGAVDHGLGIAVLQHGSEVLRHARHGAGAERLDARLLDRLEHGARILAFGAIVLCTWSV